MSLFQRFNASVRRHGVGATFAKAFAAVGDHGFDLRYGTDTCARTALAGLTIKANRENGSWYDPARVPVLRKLLRHLAPRLPGNGVFVDFGCGKGRVLLIATEFGFRDVRGVEFAHELCLTAAKNIAAYQAKAGRTVPCKVIEADATTYPISPEENVFFMYNPFNEVIMAKVVENIARSVTTEPRRILIVYLNPRCHEVIDRRPEFTLVEDSDIWGNRFRIYENRA